MTSPTVAPVLASVTLTNVFVATAVVSPLVGSVSLLAVTPPPLAVVSAAVVQVATGQGFTFNQTTPATEWTIAHNLGLRPNVYATTPGGLELEAGVLHISANVVVLSFLTPQAGTARLT